MQLIYTFSEVKHIYMLIAKKKGIYIYAVCIKITIKQLARNIMAYKQSKRKFSFVGKSKENFYLYLFLKSPIGSSLFLLLLFISNGWFLILILLFFFFLNGSSKK